MKTRIKRKRAITQIAKLIDEYGEASERVRTTNDQECIHEFRVASRNLLAIAPLLNKRQHASWSVCVKHDIKTLNRLRDLQVLRDLLKQPSPALKSKLDLEIAEALVAWHTDRKEIAPSWVNKKLNKKLKQINKKVKSNPVKTEKKLLRLWLEYFERLERKIAELDLSDLNTFHECRLAFKQFRYLSEFMADIKLIKLKSDKTLKQWQELFGEIQDNRFAINWLRKYAKEERKLIAKLEEQTLKGANKMLERMDDDVPGLVGLHPLS